MNAGAVGAVSNEILEHLKVIAILAGVILFAFIALRFWLPKLTGIQGPTNGPMQIVWRLTLEPGKTLYIVRAGSEYVMLAASDSGVQFLRSLDAAAVEESLQELSVKPKAALEFANILRPRRRSRPAERAE